MALLSREGYRALRQFRGLPSVETDPFGRQPQPAESVFEVAMHRHGLREPRIEQHVMDHWRSIMGGNYAHRCCPLRLDDRKRLFVGVSNSTLRSVLMMEKAQILARLRSVAGCGEIAEIVFTTQR